MYNKYRYRFTLNYLPMWPNTAQAKNPTSVPKSYDCCDIPIKKREGMIF